MRGEFDAGLFVALGGQWRTLMAHLAGSTMCHGRSMAVPRQLSTSQLDTS
jgi:hypothetical protein